MKSKIMGLIGILLMVFSINALAEENKQYVVGDTCETMIGKWFGEESALLETTPEKEALNEYFEVRRVSLYDDSSVSGDFMSDEVKSLENARRAGFNKFEINTSSKIFNAANNVDINSIVKKDGLYYVEAYEWIFFDYDSLNVEGFAVNVSGFGVEHEIILDENFVVISDKYDEAELSGICTKEKAVVEEDVVLMEAEDSAELFSTFYTAYNVNAAVSYSDTYALNYNSAYYNFNSLGGDCANFTSQCINAGGMPQVVGSQYGTNGWFYKTSNNRSATWTGANSLRTWMGQNRGVLIDNPSDAQIYTGSPVFYDWDKNGKYDHATFCVGKNAENVPVINSHNADYYHLVWHYNGKSSTNYSTVQLTSSNVVNGGTTGNISWRVDANGTLYIEGTGEMTDTPWKNQGLTYTAVVIGEGITSVADKAFYFVTRLKNVTLPSTMKKIGTYAFAGCLNLKTINLPSGLEEIAERAFINTSSITALQIPESVIFIGDYAFNNCPGITSVTLSDKFIYVGEGAFQECDSLLNIVIEEGVTQIPKDIFYGCNAITSVTIPESVTSVGVRAFLGCLSLTDVYLSVSENYWDNNVEVAEEAFPETATLHYAQDIVFGAFDDVNWVIDANGTLYIEGTGAINETAWLEYSEYIKNVYIGEGITDICEYAFEACTNMESCVISPGVKTIGRSAFYGCSKLTEIEIPFTVTDIGANAFRNCTKLMDVYLNLTQEEWAENVTVGSNAFADSATLHYAPPAIEFAIVENKDGRVTFGWNHDETSLSYLITVSGIEGDYYRSYEFSAEDARDGRFEVVFALGKGSYNAVVTCVHPNVMFAGGEIAFDVTDEYVQPEIDLEAVADGFDVTVKWNHIDADKYILTIFDSEGNDVERCEAEVKDAIGGKFYFDCTLEKGYYRACMTVMYPEVIAQIAEIQFPVAIDDGENYSVEYLSGEVKNGRFYAEAEVINLTDRKEADTVVIAVYKGDEMLDFVYMRMDLPKDEAVTFGGMLQGVDGATLKAFVWNDIKGMKALSNVMEK